MHLRNGIRLGRRSRNVEDTSVILEHVMTHFRLPIAIGLLAVAASAMLAQTSTASSNISPDAAAAPAGSMVPVVIQYTQDPGAIKTLIVQALGGTVTSNMHSIFALSAIVPQAGLSQLAADPSVT